MSSLFDIITVPFGYALQYIYMFVGSYGWAIVLFTLLSKILILPLTIKGKKGLISMQRMQPKMQALEKKYRNNKAKYQEELGKLYQKEKVNPLGSCLPTFITLPIMFGLYYVVMRPLSYIMHLSADQISKIADIVGVAMDGKNLRIIEIPIAGGIHENFAAVSGISPTIMDIDFNFLGVNLSQTPQWNQFNILWVIPLLTLITSLLYTFVTMEMQKKVTGVDVKNVNPMITFMTPLMMVWFSFIMPAGIGLYWIAGNVIMIVQEFFLTSYVVKQLEKAEIEEAEKLAKKKARRERLEREAREEALAAGKKVKEMPPVSEEDLLLEDDVEEEEVSPEAEENSDDDDSVEGGDNA